MRSTSRSSPRSRPTPRRRSGWPTSARRSTRWSSPTSSTASSSRGCRPCPAWPTCRSAATVAYAMRIWLDPDKLAAYRLTVQDVEDALRRQNLEVPAGRIESQQREFSVTARTDLNTVAQFDDRSRCARSTATRCACATWRAWSRGRRQRTLARAPERRASRSAPASSATPPPTRWRWPAGVRAVLPLIQRDLPPSVTVVQANDLSVFIDRSIKAVYTHRGRGRGAGGAGGVRLPAHAARVDHPAGDDPGQPDRRLRADRARRLHDQHADPAGPGAGDRPGGRRRHRRAGEHLPPHRRGHDAVPGRAARASARSASPWWR